MVLKRHKRKTGEPFAKYMIVCERCNVRKPFFNPRQSLCYECKNPIPVKSYKPYSGLWEVNRKLAIERDKVCQLCGLDKFLHIHHKDKNNRNQDIENLILLCRYCHASQHHNNVRIPIGFKQGEFGIRPIYKKEDEKIIGKRRNQRYGKPKFFIGI